MCTETNTLKHAHARTLARTHTHTFRLRRSPTDKQQAPQWHHQASCQAAPRCCSTTQRWQQHVRQGGRCSVAARCVLCCAVLCCARQHRSVFVRSLLRTTTHTHAHTALTRKRKHTRTHTSTTYTYTRTHTCIHTRTHRSFQPTSFQQQPVTRNPYQARYCTTCLQSAKICQPLRTLVKLVFARFVQPTKLHAQLLAFHHKLEAYINVWKENEYTDLITYNTRSRTQHTTHDTHTYTHPNYSHYTHITHTHT